MALMKWYSFSPLILQKLIWVPTRFSLWFFGRLEVKGLENLPNTNSITGAKQNVIFVCNHASELDPFFVPASLPFFSRFSPMFYATREKEFYDTSGWRQVFYGGMFFRAWGGYPAFVGLRDYEKSLSQHVSLLKDGVNMCVFPEGHITPDGSIQPAKGGVSFLSIYTGVPIIPVAISGTYQISPYRFFARKNRLKTVFGKPIYPEELKASINISESTISIGGNDSLVDFSIYKTMSDYVMKKVGELTKLQA